MSTIHNSEQAVTRLESLFQKCNERDEALLAHVKQLALENEQLKRTLHKLRASSAMKQNTTSTMHSKLTDALRE